MSEEIFIEMAVTEVLNTRDFCGNEREALEDFAHEYRVKLTPELRLRVFERVNEIWEESKRQARR